MLIKSDRIYVNSDGELIYWDGYTSLITHINGMMTEEIWSFFIKPNHPKGWLNDE